MALENNKTNIRVSDVGDHAQLLRVITRHFKPDAQETASRILSYLKDGRWICFVYAVNNDITKFIVRRLIDNGFKQVQVYSVGFEVGNDPELLQIEAYADYYVLKYHPKVQSCLVTSHIHRPTLSKTSVTFDRVSLRYSHCLRFLSENLRRIIPEANVNVYSEEQPILRVLLKAHIQHEFFPEGVCVIAGTPYAFYDENFSWEWEHRQLKLITLFGPPPEYGMNRSRGSLVLVTVAEGCERTLIYFDFYGTNPSHFFLAFSRLIAVILSDRTLQQQKHFSFVWSCPCDFEGPLDVNRHLHNLYRCTISDLYGCTISPQGDASGDAPQRDYVLRRRPRTLKECLDSD